MERGRGGRKRKGVRTTQTVRFPDDQLELYRKEARDLGLALGDWVVLRMAEHHKLPIPDYVEAELDKARRRRQHGALEEGQLKLGA